MKGSLIAGIVRILWGKGECVYYIGGAEVLPPPLKGQEERETLEMLEKGS